MSLSVTPAVARCGCCFFRPQKCLRHTEPCVMFGSNTRTKHSKQMPSFKCYHSSTYTYLNQICASKYTVIENFSEKYLPLISDTCSILIAIGHVQPKARPVIHSDQIGNIPVCTYAFGSVRERSDMFITDTSSWDSFMEHVGNREFSWLNCTMGSFYEYAQHKVHTRFLNCFRYMTDERFRNTVQGNYLVE